MEIVVYTDGSYREVEGFGAAYAGAAIICRDGADPVQLTSAGSEPSYISMCNVAGEIIAAMMACEYCMNTLKVTQADTIIIIYDYAGIENWCKKPGTKNFWRAKTPLSMYYRDFMNTKMKTRCRVVFHHVKSHSGHTGNTMVDAAVKEALSNYVKSTTDAKKNG